MLGLCSYCIKSLSKYSNIIKENIYKYPMTTITNFLHTNFIDSAQSEGNQVPIWILTGTRSNKITALKQYLIDNCVNANKPLVHLDLGIATLKLAKDASQKIEIDKNLYISIPHTGKPYLLLQFSSQFRKNTNNCLNVVMKHLNNLSNLIAPLKIQNNKKNKTFSLLIQGLELITSQKQLRGNLQSFINHISTLNSIYKQVSIFKYDGVLLPEHQFALQRISTCLTQIQNFDSVTTSWTVKSTVRRYTGFSNQEKYVIKSIKSEKGNRLKVQKWQAPKEEGDLKSQQQLEGELGFVVKKGDIGHKQAGIKQMIYPHLMVQNQGPCGCSKKQCKKTECQQTAADEGLIILDDEQEDDDDIDV